MWQKSVLKEDVSFTTGEVVSIPIPLLYPLSAIEILLDIVAGTTGAAALADEMKIELIKNGHEPICSLSYGELAAIDNLIHPMAYPVADLGADTTGLFSCFIPFGRFLKDKEYFLDPKGFEALDLVLTMPTLTETITSSTYSIILLREMEGVISSAGYFKLTTKKEYTAEDAIAYTLMDRAYPYALIMVGELNGADVDLASATIGLIRLNVDAGKVFPIDQDCRDLIIENQILSGDQSVATLGTPLAKSNCAILNFLKPWLGEDFLLDAPGMGSLVLEVTGKAAGEITVTAAELVK
ncbi:hypothetical protein ES708_24385 [subsurface metagenome]